MTAIRQVLKWVPTAIPVIAIVVLIITWGTKAGIGVVIVVAVLLAATILVAVQHAEVIAHKVGEPFGSLILAVAVTIIEVGLILTLSADGGPEAQTLARDTVFAAFMITTTGVMGLSIFVGAARYKLVRFNSEGAGAALATLSALAVLCLVLPDFTSAVGPRFTSGQLIFAAIASLALYVMYVVTQTISHRDFFQPVAPDGGTVDDSARQDHRPTTRATVISLVLLLLSLVAVVGLAKLESPAIEAGVKAAGFPQSFVGVIIALLILLPESISAVRSARQDRVQTSINLSLGSAMASIGLTIPAVAFASLFTGATPHLGLAPTQIVLLAITVVVSILTIVPGRATKLQGGVHLVLFAAFLFLSISP